MRFGLALDCGTDRTALDRVLDMYVPQVRLAERLGFDSVWIGQHYPAEPGWFHLPSPLLVLAALAPSTTLTLGTGVLLLPMWHPLVLAYDAAVLDQLCGGRLVLGVGIGRPHDWARFGIDRGAVGDRTDDMLAALRALWSGASSFEGRVLSVQGGIRPLPTQPGGPPLWVGGTIGRAMRRAAVLGDGWYAGSTHALHDIGPRVERYRAELVAAGKDPALARVAANRTTALAETPERAWSECGPYAEVPMRTYQRIGGLRLPEGVTPAPDADLLLIVAADLCLIGSPETVMPHVAAYAAAGVTDLVLRVAPGNMPSELVARTIALAGEHVLPHFR